MIDKKKKIHTEIQVEIRSTNLRKISDDIKFRSWLKS